MKTKNKKYNEYFVYVETATKGLYLIVYAEDGAECLKKARKKIKEHLNDDNDNFVIKMINKL